MTVYLINEGLWALGGSIAQGMANANSESSQRSRAEVRQRAAQKKGKQPLSNFDDKNNAVLTVEGDVGLGLRPKFKLGKLAEISFGGRLDVAGWAEFFPGGDSFVTKETLDLKIRIWRLEIGASAGGWETHHQGGAFYEANKEGWLGWNVIATDQFSVETWSINIDVPLGLGTVSGGLNLENIFK